MKKVFRLFAMLTMASVFTFVSCGKDTEETPAITAQELAGSEWRCQMANTVVQQGVELNVSFESMLDFIDTEKGEYFEMAVVEVPAYPAANQQMDQTFDFTYTVKGSKVILNITFEDEEGEMVSDQVELVYHPSDQTLTLDTDSPEMEQMMGTDTYVYTRVQ